MRQLIPKTSSLKSIALLLCSLSVAINVLYLVIPIFSMQVFDRVLSSESLQTLMMLVGIALFLLVTQSVIDLVRKRMMLRIAYHWERNNASTAFRRAIDQSQTHQAINSQPINDTAKVRDTLASPSLFALVDAPFSLLFLATMYLMHPYLGHIALAGALILSTIALMNILLVKSLQCDTAKQTSAFNILTSDWLRASSAIRSLGMVESLSKRWTKESNNSTVDSAVATSLNQKLQAFARFTRFALQLGVLSVAVILVINHQVTAGVLIASSMIMARVLAPIETFISSWQTLIAGKESWQRLTQQENITDLAPLEPITGTLSFEDVTIDFTRDQRPLVKRLNLHLKAGESLGIIGQSGMGKSSIMGAIVQLCSPTHGDIRLDGAALTQYPINELNQQIGYLPQNVEFLSGTITQNIARFGDSIDPQKVINAAKLAGAHQLILQLPHGYNTLIGALGIPISGGQKQKIALARALYNDPKLILLDEPESHLDSDSHSILNRIFEHARQRQASIVLISHRRSIIQCVDRCLLLKEKGHYEIDETAKIVKSISHRSREAAL